MEDSKLQTFENFQKESSPIVAKAKSYSIKSESDVETASAFLLTINTRLKEIENARLDLTAPLNQTLSKINGASKKASEPLKEAKEILSTAILSWRREAQRLIQAEEDRRRKIQEAHEKAGHQVNEPVVMQRPEKTIGNSQAVKVWRWEVVDKKLVPDEYKEIDSVRVNQSIRNMQRDGVKEMTIAGLRIYQDERLTIK